MGKTDGNYKAGIHPSPPPPLPAINTFGGDVYKGVKASSKERDRAANHHHGVSRFDTLTLINQVLDEREEQTNTLEGAACDKCQGLFIPSALTTVPTLEYKIGDSTSEDQQRRTTKQFCSNCKPKAQFFLRLLDKDEYELDQLGFATEPGWLQALDYKGEEVFYASDPYCQECGEEKGICSRHQTDPQPKAQPRAKNPRKRRR